MGSYSDDFHLEHKFVPEHDPESLPPLLPLLKKSPITHSACCLPLSTALLSHLHTLLPPAPALTLSIGSGTGLLEALLLASPYKVNIIGVEVAPSPNIYLPATHHHAVAGSRVLEPLAGEATAWVFAYPRRVGLVEEYLREFGGCGGNVQVVVWVGPATDWKDYEGCFEDWRVEVRSADEVGGYAWEMVCIAKKEGVETAEVERP